MVGAVASLTEKAWLNSADALPEASVALKYRVVEGISVQSKATELPKLPPEEELTVYVRLPELVQLSEAVNVRLDTSSVAAPSVKSTEVGVTAVMVGPMLSTTVKAPLPASVEEL